MSYLVRCGAVEDTPALVHHRVAMFTEMGVEGDYAAMQTSFEAWLQEAIPSEVYRAWLVCDELGKVVAGAGIVLQVGAPAPKSQLTRSAYVYNVYVEPDHRGRGLARRLMETIHGWCGDHGIRHVALHSSEFGKALYESMGYEATNEMRILLDRTNAGA